VQCYERGVTTGTNPERGAVIHATSRKHSATMDAGRFSAVARIIHQALLCRDESPASPGRPSHHWQAHFRKLHVPVHDLLDAPSCPCPQDRVGSLVRCR
jgi:hypothetical protein